MTHQIDVYQHIDTPVGEIELIVTVEFETVPYRRATYNDPAEGGYAEDARVVGVKLEATREPVRLSPKRIEHIEAGLDLSDLYAQAAAEAYWDRADYEYERRRDARMGL